MEATNTLEKIETAAKLDAVIKVGKLRQFNGFMSKPMVSHSLVGVLGSAVGIGAATIWYTRKLNKEPVELEHEIEILRAEQLELDFERVEKDRQFNQSIGEAALVARQLKQEGLNFLQTVKNLSARDAVGDIHYDQVGLVDDEATWTPEEGRDVEESAEAVFVPAEKRHNIFDEDNDGWNYELERQNRGGEEPYVIHVDEFVTEEMGFEQTTLTWYAGDRILTDSKDVPIYNPPSIVGELRFGHGSKDPNIVYVRNEKLRAEYEILRDPGYYESQALGSRIEREFEAGDLKHANTPRRFRSE